MLWASAGHSSVHLKPITYFKQVKYWLQANARSEYVLHHGALLGQGVDDGRALRDQRGLAEVRQQDGDGMQAVELLLAVALDLDPSDELGQQDQVEDYRGRQQRVLACVVHDDGVLTAHEDLVCVFVHRALAVADIWD
eukprot:scaffold50508_cov39-Prasinocladus_malaysianus.AAC.1